MARKRAPEPPRPEPAALRTSHAEAAAKIDDRIAKGIGLRAAEVRSEEELNKLDAEYEKWSDYNRDLLQQICTTDKLVNEYAYAGASPVMFAGGPLSHAQRLRDIRESISGKISGLESIKERLELLPVIGGAVPARTTSAPRPHTNRAFIVHGHDEGARETVARFLQRLGVDPIILHEQATGGRTIVEKLEHYSEVDFAVVLMTPDDIGSSKREGKLLPRARQNVILELGYFVGKLGRDKVCALYQEGVDMPSDYLGVGYVQLDAGAGWQLQLARELRAAGFAIDMNAL